MLRRWRRLLRSLFPLALLTVGGAYAVASWNWCGRWEARPVLLLSRAWAEGPLRAGAARVPLTPPFPVVVAGQPVPRPEAVRSEAPLHARAVVLATGDVKVGVVALEVLLVSESLTQALRERVADLGLQGVLVVATHTHSSVGGYEARLLTQLAGTGRFREEALEAVLSAGSAALHQAASHLEEVTLEVGEAREGSLVRSRSEGAAPDGTLTRAVLRGSEGPVAELLVFSAHPTLVPKRRPVVNPDWPGHLSLLREEQGGVTLVLQGAGGNASVAFDGEKGAARVQAYARVLDGLAGKAALEAVEAPRLAWARAEVTLPRPDASRLVPGFTRAAGDNFLCQSAPRVAEVGALALGPLELLGVPGEPTVGAGAVLAQRAGATGVLGLSDGYVGYVETPELVGEGKGESRLQYFAPALLERLAEGAEQAAQAAGFTP